MKYLKTYEENNKYSINDVVLVQGRVFYDGENRYALITDINNIIYSLRVIIDEKVMDIFLTDSTILNKVRKKDAEDFLLKLSTNKYNL